MARLRRVELTDWPYMVVLRAQEGQTLVRDDEDRQRLLDILRDASREYGLAIHAYSLLDDHLHLLATPQQANALSLSMQALGRRYVAGFNRRHQRQGGLWAGRYRATIIDPTRYLFSCMVFIELHAQRTHAAHRAEDYLWSSIAHHLGRRTDPLIMDHVLFWALGNTPFERQAGWRRRLDDGLSLTVIRQLAEATHKGWALAEDATLQRLQDQADRPLQPRPRGRPRKQH
ncbi:MAG TPA: transposase [Moraxellaceae bacterium]|nr:transposase [Moraxellaceae bacterium]